MGGRELTSLRRECRWRTGRYRGRFATLRSATIRYDSPEVVRMKASLAQILCRIPGEPTKKWPAGDRYATALAHGSMSVGLYAPVGHDPQTPHSQDEVYIVRSGSAVFAMSGERQPCATADVLFVAAGIEHRFENLSADFSAWVVFWGPKGGEPSA
jgi:mannose-6-phosphate isomerase-like protein (cupin superfamily)